MIASGTSSTAPTNAQPSLGGPIACPRIRHCLPQEPIQNFANGVLVTLLIPVSGVALAALVLGERLDAGEAAGMALIAAGLLILDGRAALWFKRRLAAEQA